MTSTSTEAASTPPGSSLPGELLDLINPVAARYTDPDTARFAIGDYLDALTAAGYTVVKSTTPRYRPLTIADSDGGYTTLHVDRTLTDVMDVHDFLEHRSVYGVDYSGEDYISYLLGLETLITERGSSWSPADQDAAAQHFEQAVISIRDRYGRHLATDRHLSDQARGHARRLDLLP